MRLSIGSPSACDRVRIAFYQTASTWSSAGQHLARFLAARHRSKTTRQLTQLDDRGDIGTFDITPDGKQIVFDRSRDKSDIVLIDLAR